MPSYRRNGNAPAIDFAGINQAALPLLPQLVQQWFRGGKRVGSEYLARNPHRDDRHLGSFLINVRSGRWKDFATGERGGDPISLCAFAYRVSQADAARMLAMMLGVDWRRR
jgi:hypothetical protein